MPVMLHNGKVLLRDGKVATSKNCCCEKLPCCADISLFFQLSSYDSRRVYEYKIPDDVRDFASGATSSIQSALYNKNLNTSVGSPERVGNEQYESTDTAEDEVVGQGCGQGSDIHGMISLVNTFARINNWDPSVGIGFAEAGETAEAAVFGGSVFDWWRYRNFTTIRESKVHISLSTGNVGELYVDCRRGNSSSCALIKINGNHYCFGPCGAMGLPDCTNGYHAGGAYVWDQPYYYWDDSISDFGSSVEIDVTLVCNK